jgi:hypothetical protein
VGDAGYLLIPGMVFIGEYAGTDLLPGKLPEKMFRVVLEWQGIMPTHNVQLKINSTVLKYS